MSECREYRTQFSAYLDGALAQEEARALEEHVAGCVACKAEGDALSYVTEQVRALPRVAVPSQFVAGVMAKVIEEPQGRRVLVAKAVAPGAAGEVSDLVLPGVAGDVTARPQKRPAARSAPAPCEALAEDRSALLDNAIEGTGATRVKAHLADCADCQAEQVALQRLRDRVGALRPMPVPPGFVQGVMDRVDAYEFQRLRQDQEKRDARARWLQTLSRAAQAAGFLFVVAAGMVLAAPDEPSLAWNIKRDHDVEQIAWPGSEKGKRRRASKPSAPAALPPGEAEWELSVTSLEAGPRATRSLLAKYAGIRQERHGERSYGFLVDVSRNQIDDLYRGLDVAREVETNAQSLEVTQELHAEQDQVVLKNGFVLVGQLRRDDGRTLQILAGGALRSLDRKDVARVERAGERKRLRILLHKRD